jgi:hypothetical protein
LAEILALKSGCVSLKSCLEQAWTERDEAHVRAQDIKPLSKDELWDVLVRYAGHPMIVRLFATLNEASARAQRYSLSQLSGNKAPRLSRA